MLMDKPLSNQEKFNNVDILKGCVNRICVTDDVYELFNLIGSASVYLHRLAQSRFLELKDDENNDTII